MLLLTKKITSVFVLLLAASHSFALTQAFVESGEIGQGFLVKRLDTCYLISPAHVIGDELFAYIKTNKSGAVGEAEPLETFGYDLTLLSIQGNAANSCSADINSFGDISGLLSAITTASVSSINQDSSETLTPVNLTDKSLQYFRVRPTNSNAPLYKGLSGSVVFSGKTPIGILQSIDAETQEGIVLRIDRAISTIKPFFVSSFSYGKPSATMKTTDAEGQQLALTPLSWSSNPRSVSEGVGHLVDNNSDTVWTSAYGGGVYELDFMIGSTGELESFNQLTIEVPEINKASAPKDFEVLASKSSEGIRGWRSINSSTFLKNKRSKVINFAPTKARRIKIKFYSNWGGSVISLSKIILQDN